MAIYGQSVGATDEWYTPEYVFSAMNDRFDLDVSSPGSDIVPWIPASRHITANSLSEQWRGFVWMNPPFGRRNGLIPWLEKFFSHGNGVALAPDRTSAPWWQQFAPCSDAILFVAKKIHFIGSDGKPGMSPADGTCLLAAGKRGVAALYRAQEAGLGFVMRKVAE